MRPDRGGPPVAVDGPGQLVVDNRQLPGAASDEEAEQAMTKEVATSAKP
jgi:hypothetical protein